MGLGAPGSGVVVASRWNADGYETVRLGVRQINWCFKSKVEAAVRIHRWVSQCKYRWFMFEKIADVIAGDIEMLSVTALILEVWLPSYRSDWWACMPGPPSPANGPDTRICGLPLGLRGVATIQLRLCIFCVAVNFYHVIEMICLW